MLIRFIPKLYCLYQVYTCYDSFMLRQFDVLTRNADFDQDCMQCIHIHDMMHLYMTMGRLTINTDYDQDCIQCIHVMMRLSSQETWVRAGTGVITPLRRLCLRLPINSMPTVPS